MGWINIPTISSVWTRDFFICFCHRMTEALIIFSPFLLLSSGQQADHPYLSLNCRPVYRKNTSPRLGLATDMSSMV